MRGENQFGDDIPNEDLTTADLPRRDASFFPDIAEFALTFDGYRDCGFELCARIERDAFDAFRKSGNLPDSLTALRRCLFFERRSLRDSYSGPSPEDLRYAHALVEAIRERVESGTLT